MKPRTAFVDFINYIHTKLDFEELVDEGFFNTYLAAMEFVEEVAGNALYSELYKEDYNLLEAADSFSTTSELVERTGYSLQSISARINKLIRKGLLFSTTEKRVNYYKITPYGKMELEKAILDEDSLYY